MSSALILVDLQHDFLPGGALAVPDGDAVLKPAVELIESNHYSVIVATQDWHPAGHQSFASAHPGSHVGQLTTLHGLPQVMWPDHCVQGTHGAAFSQAVPLDKVHQVFQKGTDPTVDSYSGFYDNGRRHDTGLAEYLRQHGITHVTVVGLATDYCVKWTALDAATEGFTVDVPTAACRGVELQDGDVEKALDELRAAGVRVH